MPPPHLCSTHSLAFWRQRRRLMRCGGGDLRSQRAGLHLLRQFPCFASQTSPPSITKRPLPTSWMLCRVIPLLSCLSYSPSRSPPGENIFQQRFGQSGWLMLTTGRKRKHTSNFTQTFNSLQTTIRNLTSREATFVYSSAPSIT